MASGYDVTIKRKQHHVIERLLCVCAADAVNVLMYFVVVTLLFLLFAKHSSVALPCKLFVYKCL